MVQKQIPYAKQIHNEASILAFDMISDVHITLAKKNKYLMKCLEDIKQRNVTTLAILGDLTNNGYSFQWTSCFQQLQQYPLPTY